MNNEYVVINETAILKRMEGLEKDINNALTNEQKMLWTHELNVLRILLSQSTPLIPGNIKPLQELIDEGYDPYDSAHHLQVQRMLKVIQEYISNLKLDI
jgi:hypothetical protein